MTTPTPLSLGVPADPASHPSGPRGGYESAFSTRYASPEMQYLFSQDMKFRTYRQLWIALAAAERALGLDITEEQLAQMRAHWSDINYPEAEAREREVRHDVMAHIYAYGLQCPAAAPIIHLGATSCYVTDNADVIIYRHALRLVLGKVRRVIARLAKFADEYKALPCLAYTHLQPAQPTTVGKRACLWIYELLTDCEELEYRVGRMALLGSKGTTGTQASFMELFGGDGEKVRALERMIAEAFGFERIQPVSGQTYSRKLDSQVMDALCGVACSAHKFASDMRILQSFKEMEEPFEAAQVGSSAMPYKRNPMRCERMCSLSRYVISNSLNPAMTAANQWMERTLDDSANKRIAMSEAFLAVDSILNIYLNVSQGLVVYPAVITSRLAAELPFMASENIMMDAVLAGGDRQALHERIREHSQQAGKRVKEQGLPNDLIRRLATDPAFALEKLDMGKLLDPRQYTGRSAEQVEEFLEGYVKPALAGMDEDAGDAGKVELKV